MIYMEYRALQAAEIPAWREIEEYAFVLRSAAFDPYMEHVFALDQVRCLFGPDGELSATLVLEPFRLHWQGSTLQMGGIASVASPPEGRRRGYVGQLLTAALAEMKERKIALSALYPFAAGFYRRFGWGDGVPETRLSIPVTQLRSLQRAPGHIRRLSGGSENWAAFDSIYTRFADSRRGMLVRGSETHWRRRVNGPSKAVHDPIHGAIWSPGPGAEPEGYMLYQFQETGEHHDFSIREWVALTPLALEGLFGFAANHDSRVQNVTVKSLPDLPLWHLLPDPGHVRAQVEPGFQIRLVDLPAAFAQRPWPEDLTGSLTIGVTDEQAPWNTGTWRVRFNGGRAQVEPSSRERADLTASIEVWSQIYAGGVTPLQALRQGRLSGLCTGALDLLTRATAGDPLCFFEFF